jgi:formylmethanofuran dehydrogenase subunit C
VSRLTFRLKAVPRARVDLSPLTPARLAGMNEREIAAIPLLTGNRRVRAGELFGIKSGDAGDIVIAGSCDRLDFIGRAMTGGTMTIDGDAGAYCGLGLGGGDIAVRGSAGAYAAAGMTGGRIEISGNAGERCGGALPGEMKGMSGGLVVVRGNAGERLGDRMRRGTILVEGGIGGYAASRMIAGTIVALGADVGPYPGLGMRRGTLILRGRAEADLPTFADCGEHELGFLELLLRHLTPENRQLKTAPRTVRRFAGDRACGGKGEILVWGT